MVVHKPLLRSPIASDAPAIADVWWTGWNDGHLGHVPDELVAARTKASFDERVAQRIDEQTVVAEIDGDVCGFAMVIDDEVEQVYVRSDHRGSGVASALLRAAADLVRANGHGVAWLAVVAGNVRARRFYEREGWVDEGPFEHAAPDADQPIIVPAHRYTIRVDRADQVGVQQ